MSSVQDCKQPVTVMASAANEDPLGPSEKLQFHDQYLPILNPNQTRDLEEFSAFAQNSCGDDMTWRHCRSAPAQAVSEGMSTHKAEPGSLHQIRQPTGRRQPRAPNSPM